MLDARPTLRRHPPCSDTAFPGARPMSFLLCRWWSLPALPRLLGRATGLSLVAAGIFSSPSVGQQLQPEEAGYLAEQGQLIAATCRVGTTATVLERVMPIFDGQSIVGAHPVYRHVAVTELDASYTLFGRRRPNWRQTRLMTERLLAPSSLEPVRVALLGAVQAQSGLAGTRGDQRRAALARIRRASAAACSRNAAFRQGVARRPRAPSSADWSITYRPPAIPVDVTLNSRGDFSLSVSQTVKTPYGSVTLAASESYGHPRRLVIRSGSTQRNLLLDRPFKVFVPTDYGVNVINTRRDLILEVVARPPSRR